MATKKPIPKTGEEGKPGKPGRSGGGSGGTGGPGGAGQVTGGRGGAGGEGGSPDSRRQILTVIFIAVLALGVLSTMILVVNNKLERSVTRAGIAVNRASTAIEEIRAVQEDTQGLKAALDLAERQRQAQARRIMQLIKALREAGVEVPPLPKNGSALSLGPGASQGGGNTGPGAAKSPSPGAPPTAQPQPSEPPQTPPSPNPPGPPPVVCFDPPAPIAGPICIGPPT